MAFSRSGTPLAAAGRGVWEFAGGAWSLVGGPRAPRVLGGTVAFAVCPSGTVVAATSDQGTWEWDGRAWRQVGGGETWRPMSMAAVTCGRGGRLLAIEGETGPWQYAGGRWSRLPGTGDALTSGGALTLAPDGTAIFGGQGVWAYGVRR